jgi:hypothetical protein
MAVTQPKLTTADELWAIGDDECRYDLIDGELYRISPASPKHGAVVHKFSLSLGIYLHANPIGEA